MSHRHTDHGSTDGGEEDLRPLSGLRVVDFSRLLPGAHAGMVLADFGADILKIEAPPRGDGIRHALPTGSWGGSGRHEVLNRGKRSICLDLRDPDDLRIAHDLVERADVLVESFRPGVMDRLGLGWDAVRERRPDLVYVSMTGYGQDGSRRAEPSHDINFLALSGLLAAGPSPGTPPALPQLTFGDLGGGSLQAVTAILLALRVRERTGRGQHIDVSMLDGTVSLLAAQFGDQAAVGPDDDATVGGRLSGAFASYGLYRDRDGGWWAVGALERKFWVNTLEALDLPDLVVDDHLEPSAQPAMRARLEARFAELGTGDLSERLADRDTCVTLVRSLQEAAKDPVLQERGALVPLHLPDGVVATQPAPWPRLSVGAGRAGAAPAPLDGSRAWVEHGAWSDGTARGPADPDPAPAEVPRGDRRWPSRVFAAGTEPDPRFSLANERTFLAWARTALGLLAAALVVDLADLSWPEWLIRSAGIGLAGAAVVAVVAGWAGWMRREQALRHSRPLPGTPATAVLATVVVIVGVLCVSAAVR